MGQYLDIAKRVEARLRVEGCGSSREPAAVSPTLTTDAEKFLARHITPAARAVFPDWEGLLIKSAVLDMSVWVVRNRREGEELARETGHPALLLDDVLVQKGRTPEESRAALLPVLIMGMVQ